MQHHDKLRSVSLAADNTHKTVGERIQALMTEARELAQDSIKALIDEARQVRNVANEIEQGGDIYGAGIREEARQLGEFIIGSTQRLEKLMTTVK